MPNLTLPLAGDGPLIDVGFAASTGRIDVLKLVSRPTLSEAGLDDRPDRHRGRDLDRLRRRPPGPPTRAIGKIDVSTAVGGQVRSCDLFDICLAFASLPAPTVMHVDLPIIEGIFTGNRYNALIGGDILSRCLFIYNGTADTFTLAF